jgi:hypothetical protein
MSLQPRKGGYPFLNLIYNLDATNPARASSPMRKVGGPSQVTRTPELPLERFRFSVTGDIPIKCMGYELLSDSINP